MDFIIPVLVTILIIVVLTLLAGAIRIVPEFQRLVVFRLGRCVGPKGPGVVFLYPFLDTAIRVRSPRTSSGDPRPDFDHQGQRADFDRFPLVLQSVRSGGKCAPGQQF